ncbi:MAG: hypothetical protein FJ303_20955 [Planctomycetes bacterium]|nr:hypothetical protein [Planctomycetota bacterium]
MTRFLTTLFAAIFASQSAFAQAPALRLEVFPGDRVLQAPNAAQQLAVVAHFPNGTKRDVTRLTQFNQQRPIDCRRRSQRTRAIS